MRGSHPELLTRRPQADLNGNEQRGAAGVLPPAAVTWATRIDGWKLTGHGQGGVLAAGHSGGIAGDAPIGPGISAAPSAAALGHPQEEKGSVREDQPVAPRLQGLSVSVPTHFGLGLPVESAPQGCLPEEEKN